MIIYYAWNSESLFPVEQEIRWLKYYFIPNVISNVTIVYTCVYDTLDATLVVIVDLLMVKLRRNFIINKWIYIETWMFAIGSKNHVYFLLVIHFMKKKVR